MRSPPSNISGRNLEIFSDLPDDIIASIFSRITNKEAIRFGLSSKAMFREVQKRPALMFGESDDQLQSVFEKRSKEEINYMYKTLVRYCDQNIHLEAFTLKFSGYDPWFDETARQCVDLATKRGLKSLNLSTDKYLILPWSVYEVESLVHLSLRGWVLRRKIGVWPNLKRLCLHRVNMKLTPFENIIRSSPLIETLEIYSCDVWPFGFNFRVSNLRNLKQLTVQFKYLAQTLEVSATPNLKSIACSYEPYYATSKIITPFKNLGQLGYQNLRTLSLDNCYFEGILDNFSSEFPQLEELAMNRNDALKRISLSSPSLKKIRLVNMRSLEEAQFEVPNIILFEFMCDSRKCRWMDSTYQFKPKFSFIGNPDGWIAHINVGSDQWRIEGGSNKWCWSTTS